MREIDKSFRREELELLSSAELNRMVRSELEKDSVDRDTVLQILRILEERESRDPALQDVDTSEAWEEFQTHFAVTEEGCPESSRAHTRKKSIPWFAKSVIAAIIVFALLVVTPPALGYENIFELIGRWTQDVFELFNPNSTTDPQGDYVFKTDHPGLQQVYDEVKELGITQPVVPTWLPDGYELEALKIIPTAASTKIYAIFKNGENKILIQIKSGVKIATSKYEKSDDEVIVHEMPDTICYIMRNQGEWTAVWEKEGLECSITMSDNVDVLYKMLRSIYTEDYE